MSGLKTGNYKLPDYAKPKELPKPKKANRYYKKVTRKMRKLL